MPTDGKIAEHMQLVEALVDRHACSEPEHASLVACVEDSARALIAAEREACARICAEQVAEDPTFKEYEDNYKDGWIDASNECTWAIRARGVTPTTGEPT